MIFNNNFRIFSVPLLFFATLSVVMAGDVAVYCRGVVNSEVDFKGKRQEATNLDIVLNQDLGKVTVRGNWGCPLLAIPQDLKLKFPCIEFEPKFSENEISYVGSFDGDKYSAIFNFVLNRNSGSLATFSATTPKPGTAARWGMFESTGSFACEIAKRKF